MNYTKFSSIYVYMRFTCVNKAFFYFFVYIIYYYIQLFNYSIFLEPQDACWIQDIILKICALAYVLTIIEVYYIWQQSDISHFCTKQEHPNCRQWLKYEIPGPGSLTIFGPPINPGPWEGDEWGCGWWSRGTWVRVSQSVALKRRSAGGGVVDENNFMCSLGR